MSLSYLDDEEGPDFWDEDCDDDNYFNDGGQWDEPPTEDLIERTTPEPKRRKADESDSTPSSGDVILPVPTCSSQSSPQSECSTPVEDSSAQACRRRLRFKQSAEPSFRKVEDRFSVEGYPVFQHPLYIKYMKLSAGTRRLASKRVSQVKYRLMTQFKETGTVTVNNERFDGGGASCDASVLSAVETAFFMQVAKDQRKPTDERGYALTQIASSARAFIITAEGNESRIGGLPSVLLTYIGPYGLLDWEQVDVSKKTSSASTSSCASLPPQTKEEIVFSMTVEEMVVALQNNRTVLAMAYKLETLATETCNKLRTPHWAFAVELCCKSFVEERLIRVHAHLWLTLKNQSVFMKDLALGHPSHLPFVNWKAIQYLSGQGARSQGAHLCGNFYALVRKIGSILQRGTLHPWHDYPVKDTWITSFLASRKITALVAREAYLSSIFRAQYNIQQLEYVEMERKKMAVLDRIKQVDTLLRKELKPWRTFVTINKWRDQYNTLLGRYHFLVLDGPSCTGKTRFALCLNPPGATLYADCSMGGPMLRMFDRENHLAIVLDEIRPQVAITFKKALQASNELVTLGSSPTMCSAYNLYLHRVMIICCSNTWADDLAHMKPVDRDWLESNSVYVEVAEPMWLNH